MWVVIYVGKLCIHNKKKNNLIPMIPAKGKHILMEFESLIHSMNPYDYY